MKYEICIVVSLKIVNNLKDTTIKILIVFYLHLFEHYHRHHSSFTANQLGQYYYISTNPPSFPTIHFLMKWVFFFLYWNGKMFSLNHWRYFIRRVADVKYHRKPNCDNIFLDDPNNPKLYVCQVCNKKVRSKWHHFQTHYSRNHKCSDCDAVYSRIDTLRTHAKKRHHTVIPRYYYGIPANVWHRAIVQSTDQPKSHTVLPPKPQTITSGQLASVENAQ